MAGISSPRKFKQFKHHNFIALDTLNYLVVDKQKSPWSWFPRAGI
jgi:hypothetical protein